MNVDLPDETVEKLKSIAVNQNKPLEQRKQDWHFRVTRLYSYV